MKQTFTTRGAYYIRFRLYMTYFGDILLAGNVIGEGMCWLRYCLSLKGLCRPVRFGDHSSRYCTEGP